MTGGIDELIQDYANEKAILHVRHNIRSVNKILFIYDYLNTIKLADLCNEKESIYYCLQITIVLQKFIWQSFTMALIKS